MAAGSAGEKSFFQINTQQNAARDQSPQTSMHN
jgi:hypothetical protein